jgi:hypothetical protein
MEHAYYPFNFVEMMVIDNAVVINILPSIDDIDGLFNV